MSQLERNQKVLVSKDVTVDATSLANLAEGELAVLKPDMTFLTAGETIADAPYIYIVQGTDTLGDPKFSQKITGKQVVNYSGSERAAAAEQVTYIGDNGTTGAILPVSNSTEYSLHIVFKEDKVAFSERQLRRSFHYTTDATATAAEIMNAFVALINADSICKTRVTAATSTGGGNQGIKLTGKAQTYKKIDGYEQVYFEVSLDLGFTRATPVDELGYIYVNGADPTSTNSNSVSPSRGVGTYALVTDLEVFALGHNGITNRTKFPIPDGASNTYAVSTESYDMYVIDHNDKHASADANGHISSPLQTIIAVPYDAAAGNGGALEALLNPWMASCPGNFAPVTL